MRIVKIIKYINDLTTGLKNSLLRETNLHLLKPKWLWFGVTDRCNSRCKHCDIWRQKPVENPLTPKEIEKAFSDPLFKEIRYILNSGGEPVLRDDLEEILLIEHKIFPKAKIQLSTNGLLPDRVIDVVKFALSHDIALDVGISLDGIGDKHDYIRGMKGNFERVDKLLRKLIELRRRYENKITPTIGFTLSNFTLPSLNEVREYAQGLDISFLVQWYNESSYYSNIGKSLSGTNERMLKTVESLPSSIIREMWIKWLKGKSIKFPCFAMYTFCVLKCDGNIVPCLNFWDINVGNVRKNSPTEIWNSPKANEARRIVKNCQGCLNSWGTGWSFSSCFWPKMLFYLKHPFLLAKKIAQDEKHKRVDGL